MYFAHTFRLALLFIAALYISLFSLQAKPSDSGLLFTPLRAYIFEPRVGGFAQPAPEKLRLDIGTSLDLLTLDSAFQPAIQLAFGVDFFTFTRLRSEGNFKFPVETTDFFFGVNSSMLWQKPFDKSSWLANADLSARLRIAHISSHLSDGYLPPNNRPIQEVAFVYSREFIEAILALDMQSIRIYGGTSILFSSIPNDFAILTPQLGFDAFLPLSKNIGIVGGFDARFTTAENTNVHYLAAQAGVKFGSLRGRGLSVNIYATSGNSIHGLFFRDKEEYVGVGFQAEL